MIFNSKSTKSRKDGERFQCLSCDSNYSRVDKLNAHIKKFHNNEPATTDIKGTVANDTLGMVLRVQWTTDIFKLHVYHSFCQISQVLHLFKVLLKLIFFAKFFLGTTFIPDSEVLLITGRLI